MQLSQYRRRAHACILARAVSAWSPPFDVGILDGQMATNGWELTYEMALSPGVEAGPSVGKAHVIYRELAGGHYKCSWADVNCADAAAAEAVCRSMRVKR